MQRIKKYSFISLIIGIASTLTGILLPVFAFVSYTAQGGGGVGIIGGADSPTYQFMAFQIFGGLPIYALALGAVLIIASLFCLIFRKTVARHCSLKTTALSLSLSFTGSLGLTCVLIWYSVVAFHEASTHPIEYSASIILGLLAFAIFIVLIVIYCKARRGGFSLKGVLIDIGTSILTLPLFFLICMKIIVVLQQIAMS